MRNKFLPLILLFQSMFLLSCKKDTINDYSTATLKDFTGTDGCKWAFVLRNNKKLEPNGLEKFNVDLVDGAEYYIKYQKVEGGMSICMMGEIVEITDIHKK